MTPQESSNVVALLTAAWPYAPITKPTMVVWMQALADIDHDVAAGAAKEAIRTEGRFPSVARFREHCQAIQRHRALVASTVPALPPVERTDEERAAAKREIAKARAVLNGGPR